MKKSIIDVPIAQWLHAKVHNSVGHHAWSTQLKNLHKREPYVVQVLNYKSEARVYISILILYQLMKKNDLHRWLAYMTL